MRRMWATYSAGSLSRSDTDNESALILHAQSSLSVLHSPVKLLEHRIMLLGEWIHLDLQTCFEDFQ